MDQPLTVLIVEDEALIAMDLGAAVESLGAHVVGHARTSEAAIALAAEHRPDLVLMDVRLAGDVDGIETARVIRGQHGTEIVFVTGHSDPHTMQRIQTIENAQILRKPVTPGQVRESIRRALPRRS